MSSIEPEPVGSHSGGGSGSGNSTDPMAERVYRRARKMVGTAFRPGKKEQCAAFVRAVFEAEGIRLPVAKRPPDAHLIPAGECISEAHANSLSGDEIGQKVPENQARPGDIVLYQNTYGDYRRGVITHVAIFAGNGEIIHRPTFAKPVCVERLHYATIAEIRRPRALISAGNVAVASHAAKIFLHDGRASALKDGVNAPHMDVRIQYRGGAMHVFVDGHEVRAKVLELQIFS